MAATPSITNMELSPDRERKDQIFHYENGDVFNGILDNGKKEGFGTYKAGGAYYEGSFKNDERHGHGKLTDEKNNLTYIGT